MSTYVPKPSSIERQWHVIDADEQVLGRVATIAARLLQGKHKPQYAPFLDTGDFVIITNAQQVKLLVRRKYRSSTVVTAVTRVDCAKNALKHSDRECLPV